MGLYFSGLKTSSGSMDVHRGCITRSITGNRRGSVWPMRPSVMNSGLRGESAVRCLRGEADDQNSIVAAPDATSPAALH